MEHLRGFRTLVPASDPLIAPVVLQVTYSSHVFSEKWDDAFPLERRFEEKGEARAFCPVRYGCSIVLPQLVNYHVGGKAFEGKDANGNRNHFFYAEADGIAYPIFFRLGKATNIRGATGILHIISAYQNLGLMPRHKYQSVKFARLVHNTCC